MPARRISRRLRIDRRVQGAQALAREARRYDDGIGLPGETALPQRQRGRVDGRLGARAAAVQPHARERVAAVAARAVGALREAQALGADEPVVVEVQHDARAGLARSSRRPG